MKEVSRLKASTLDALLSTMTFEYCGGGEYELAAPLGTGRRQFPHAVAAWVKSGRIIVSGPGVPKRSIIASGEGLLTPPGFPHQLHFEPAGKLRCVWAHFNCFAFGGLDLFALFEVPLRMRAAAATQFAVCNRTLLKLRADPEATHFDARVFRIKQLEWDLAKVCFGQCCIHESAGVAIKKTQRLQPVVQHMEKNMRHRLANAQLCDLVGLSEPRFRSLFGEAFGCGPIDYLIQLRMKAARRLLLSSKLAVKAIAGEVGYDDPFHFSRLFKKVTGMSPRDYRTRGDGFLPDSPLAFDTSP